MLSMLRMLSMSHLASAAGLLSGCCGAELWDFSCCFDDAASAGRCILAISCCLHFGFAWNWQFILSRLAVLVAVVSTAVASTAVTGVNFFVAVGSLQCRLAWDL
ncbi:hypothetical protein Nepgr_029680 [Nepenthes gracilis]|uniref:Uncharacterized protein n=1 Tax=Nepenthes gracilis TaxID=150966 RepID=A0AAD3Y380_NEPGR|nr:hypothetical protein Nepgr_029680 [Nepenthes gracilis]